MTKMLPPTIPDSVRSSAERKLFGVIKHGLSDDWTALYSVGLASHPNKRWAEIDFLLVGPQGIFCLEVKGGRVSRDAGLWLFMDRSGNVSRKQEGPFEQAATAAAALRRYLLDNGFPGLQHAAFGYGVLMPDIAFTATGPDIESRVIYDVRNIERPFNEYVHRLADFAADRAREIDSDPMLLSVHDRAAVVELLRPEFDLRPSLRIRIGEVNHELLRLTSGQYKVLDALEENPRMIVRGGAGTGKTLLAVEESRHRAAARERVLLCCFNKHLAAHLRQVLSDVPGVDVWHMHGLMASLVAEAGLTHKLPWAQEADLFALFYPELAVEALVSLNRLETYDMLIVDEAQDLLLETHLDVFDALLKGNLVRGSWRFFLDPNQDMFGGTAFQGLKRLNVYDPVQFRLTVNCRNTKPVGIATAILSGAECDETLSVEGPEVEQYWCRDVAHMRREVSKCLGRLLSDGVAPADIVILSRYRRENGSMRDGFLNLPYEMIAFDDNSPPRASAIRYATISSFKGLESDSVILTDVDDLEHEEALAALYVGASRARAWLGVFFRYDLQDEYGRRAQEYGARLRWRIDAGTIRTE